VKNITIARRSGLWTVSCQYVREIVDPEPSQLSAVGIDRGVVVFAALSNGAQIAPAACGKKARKALARAQRKLSRKKIGSNNRRKQVRRVARLHARVARARKDFLHKASHHVAQNHGTVVLEKLEVANMVRSAAGTLENPGRNVRQKSGLNRAILDQGWHTFRVLLDYKLRERGGRLIEVPAAYTSLTCAVCGRIDAASRVSQSRFVCAACGHTTNADENAAINILRRADSPVLPVEASRRRAYEAGTRRRGA
jgi:putative transposase